MPTPIRLSPWQSFCNKWKAGCGSDLCGRASRVVLARGSLPCDVFFSGEAPGDSEDTLGKPFVGPAGANFQRWVIDKAVPKNVTYALGNLLGCIPTDEDGNKSEFPEDDVVHQCAPRLVELVSLARPKLLVCVGSNASQFLGIKSKGMKHGIKLAQPYDEVPRIELIHPAAILRMNIAQQGLQWQRCEVVLRNAIEEHILTMRGDI